TLRPLLPPLSTRPLPRSRSAVDLQTRAAQAVDTEPVDVAFPGQKLIARDHVAPTYLFDRDPVGAHGLDDGCLASHRPPLPQRRQLGHPARRLVQAEVILRSFGRRQSEVEYCRRLHEIGPIAVSRYQGQ